ncbi:MAG: SMC-Scp complex subunit ScpB [Patescibacteria group bacterium]
MEYSKDTRITAAIEALLFVYGEPMEIKRIADILKVEENAIDEALKELESGYLAENRGLRLVFNSRQVQLATKPDFTDLLEDFIKEEFKENLTPASLETLSLVAYLGPLSRVQIDYHRGVNSSFILRNLLIRGLIERFPDPQKSNVYLYQSSFDLLKYLGISKIEELPEYEKFKTII